jgi:hypothetical protein
MNSLCNNRQLNLIPEGAQGSFQDESSFHPSSVRRVLPFADLENHNRRDLESQIMPQSEINPKNDNEKYTFKP